MESEQQQAIGLLRHAGDKLWLALVVDPAALLNSLAGAPDTTLDAIRIHDLDQHSKEPLFETGSSGESDVMQQRSELSVGNRTWLLTTDARTGELAPGAQRSWQSVWLTGLTVTGLFALACYLLGRRISRLQSGNRQCLQELEEQSQQLGNIRVEKNIIRQALEESEQRTRDLVDISPDITAELDESGRIGFISSQVADELGRAPADLDGQPLSKLLAESHRQAFTGALEAARQEHNIQSADIRLLDREGNEVSAKVRILSLRDAVYGCTGYRLGIRIC
jgi:PAS domain S-box-containing protein